MDFDMYKYMCALYKDAEGCKYNMMCENVFEYKNLYRNLLNEKLREISYLLEDDAEVPSNQRSEFSGFRQRKFTLEELSKYNGINGNASYVSVNGIVYDVSLVKTWTNGAHFGVFAGSDATEKFNTCHAELEILNKLPQVGVLIG